MLLIGEDPRKHINDFSNQFQRDFLQLLRTSHGEKKIHMNHFYQEYIANKEHVHMNSTKWPSLTEYAKHLGREGLCRVEETDKGLHISWIDNSPEALRRQDAIRKKERQDRGDEQRERRVVEEQVERARLDALEKGKLEGPEDTTEEAGSLRREPGEKIKLDFKPKPKVPEKDPSPPLAPKPDNANDTASTETPESTSVIPHSDSAIILTPTPSTVPLKLTLTNKPKNVFAAPSKKNALGGVKAMSIQAPKRMSQAERIMKEEIERKRVREASGPPGLNVKRQRVG